MAKIFAILAGLGLIFTIIFLIGLTVASFKKKKTKVWIAGLVISILATLILYAISFLSIFQLYSLTSQ